MAFLPTHQASLIQELTVPARLRPAIPNFREYGLVEPIFMGRTTAYRDLCQL